MSGAIYKRITAVVIIVLAVYSAVFLYLYSGYSLNRTKNEMLDILESIDSVIDYSVSENINRSIEEGKALLSLSDSRITIISPPGEVLADTGTDSGALENHSQRPEVIAALSGKTGINVRFSDTLGINMLYIAKKSTLSDNILRIAIPYSNKLVYIKTLLPTAVITLIITLIVALIISREAARRITGPLRELTGEILKIQSGEELRLKSYDYSELNNIAGAINTLSDRIDKAMTNIQEINRRMEYILDNMKDGLIFIDHNRNVIGINDSAREMLECTGVKKYLNIIHYTQNLNIIDAVSDAIDSRRDSYFDMELDDGRIIAIHVSRVMRGVFEKEHGGVIILLIDVSAERSNEKMRQSFFANASHELKTPITSIRGYSELLTSDIPYTDEQKKDFIMRIKNESENMTDLINDILSVSMLESGKGGGVKTSFSMREMLDEMKLEYEPMLNENELKMEIYCGDIVICEDKSRLKTLLNNLISNAVKYNVRGGSVFVTVAVVNNKMCIEVSDTGIGIPEADRSRVFERFYRVDKGRSKKIGGTGLGLSIVKHIVNSYNGTISLESAADKGTTVKIELKL